MTPKYFENIGNKIQQYAIKVRRWAIFNLYFSIVAVVVSFIALFCEEETVAIISISAFAYFLVTGAFGIFSSMLLYANGQRTNDIHEIRIKLVPVTDNAETKPKSKKEKELDALLAQGLINEEEYKQAILKTEA